VSKNLRKKLALPPLNEFCSSETHCRGYAHK